ncbi:MAG TPA: DUF6607 family protein [Gammaproteobacteria bacterium]
MRALRMVIAVVVVALAAQAHAEPRQFTFSWPFEESDAMRPRGGTTRGAPLTLATEPSAAWRAVQEPGLTKFERDRRAILAMAGGYRTTFDFLETVGFTAGFTPSRPYQSWGTEYIYVVEDLGTFIRLQHLMVMFIADRDGKVQGPFVQKHWRQDWRYEDTDLHVFVGRNRWVHQTKTADEVRGLWSQAVFQVDDSPRYESVGEWEHYGSYSAWTSGRTARPLPRRESSVRSDYQILEGTNRHALTPTGWVQEEDNLKLVLDEQGQPAADVPYLSREVGVARYEHVVDFDFSAGDQYWQRTGVFWRDVRAAWDAVYAERESFEYLEEVDGQEMFVPLFEHAERLAGGEPYDAAAAAEVIRATFARHLR